MFSLLILLSALALAGEGGRYLFQTSALPLERGATVVEATALQPTLVGARRGLTEHLELWGGGGILLDWGGVSPVAGLGVRGAWSLTETFHGSLGVGAFHPSLFAGDLRGGVRGALTLGRAERHHSTASCAVIVTSRNVGVIPSLAGTLAGGDRWDLGAEGTVEIWDDLGDITVSPVVRRALQAPGWSLTFGWPWAINQYHMVVEGGGEHITRWGTEAGVPALRLEVVQ